MCCEEVAVTGEPAHAGHAAVTRHVHLEPAPASVPRARHFLRDVLAEQAALPDDAAELVALLATELVTNAVLHARTTIELGVCVDGAEILVAVADLSEGRPQRQAQSDVRTDGRGMALVADLADRWGVTPRERGKTVWFSIGAASRAMA